VFLWADESQYFVNSFDSEFQSTCRSSRACTVYLTQSLPTYYARIGGDNPQHRADMLLANFVTKIFHNNADPVTNRWASDTIGRSLQRRASYNEGRSSGLSSGMNMGENASWGSSSGGGYSSDGKGGSSSSVNWGSNQGGGDSWGRNRGLNTGESVTGGYSETMDAEIEPGDFSRLLTTGGPSNQGKVTGVWFQAGKRFADSGGNYLFVRFQQAAQRSTSGSARR
ncbi:MAG: TraM recognition domain-containing protein, partial [bacterium]